MSGTYKYELNGHDGETSRDTIPHCFMQECENCNINCGHKNMLIKDYAITHRV